VSRAAAPLNSPAQSCSLPPMSRLADLRTARRVGRVLALWAALGAGATAAEPYRLELLVFARAEDPAALAEAPGYRPDCLARAQPMDSAPAEPGRAAAVPAGERQLSAESQAIQRGGAGLRLLVHTAWQQELPTDAPGAWVRIGGDGPLEGCVRAWLTPVPEVEVDLAYDAASGERFALYGTAPLRPGDVQYFDHPVLGALLRLDSLAEAAASAPPAPTPPAAPAAEPARPAVPATLPPPPKKPFRW